MRIKANKGQVEGITLLLGHLIDSNPAKDVAEELLEEIVNKIFIRLSNKTMQLHDVKTNWNFSLSSLEARAFYLFYQNTHIDFVAYPYEGLLLRSLFNQIDKIYGKTSRTNQASRRLVAGTSLRRLDS